MNKLRIFTASCIVFFLLSTSVNASENVVFSNKILNLAYTQVNTIIGTKTQRWNDSAKKAIQIKTQPIIQALRAIDQAAKKKDKV